MLTRQKHFVPEKEYHQKQMSSFHVQSVEEVLEGIQSVMKDVPNGCNIGGALSTVKNFKCKKCHRIVVGEAIEVNSH